MNENIKIVLDQILNTLENLEKKESKNQPQIEVVQLNEINKRIDDIEGYGPVINKNISSFKIAFEDLRKKFETFRPVIETRTEYHYGVLFKIHSWIETIKKGRVVMFLTGILLISVLLNLMWFQEKEKFHDDYYKFRASLFFNAPPDYVDSVFYKHKNFIIEKIDSVEEAGKRKEKIKAELMKVESKRQMLKNELSNNN